MKEVFDSIIDKLEDLHAEYINQYGIVGSNPRAMAVSRCIRTVEEVQEEYNGGWIPCSERLPDKKETYLVTVEKFGVTFARFTGQKDNLHFDANVIAWQPLPAPYTPKEPTTWHKQIRSRFERVE